MPHLVILYTGQLDTETNMKVLCRDLAEEKTALMYLCFIYLTQFVHKSSGDSVAKFHLANGAKLHDINWAADLSKKGLAQSSSMMVNYLYELSAVEDNHEKFVKKEVVFSRSLSSL